MSATTIKIEDPLLHEIQEIKDPNQSVSAYVKEVLEREISQRHMAEAAQKYQVFLAENREEAKEVESWEAAPLDRAPRVKRR